MITVLTFSLSQSLLSEVLLPHEAMKITAVSKRVDVVIFVFILFRFYKCEYSFMTFYFLKVVRL